MTTLWMPSDNLVAQLGHFGWGAMLILLFILFGHLWLGVILVLSGTGAKEFIFDWLVEGQKFGDNAFDFSMYAAGVGFGLLMYAIRLKVA